MSSLPERREFQPSFPGFESVPKESSVTQRRPPQPRLGPERLLTDSDFSAHFLDLKFRGEVSRWLDRRNFPLGEVLEEQEEKMVRLYFWRCEGRWLNQNEVAAQLGLSEKNTEAVSRGAKSALGKISRREESGPEAIEVLKLPWFFYQSLLRAGISTFPEILEIEDKEEICRLCGSPLGLQLLKEAFLRQGIDWSPQQVEFSREIYDPRL